MHDQFGEEIAVGIRRLLAQRELTGTDLAALIGVRQQWISRRLTGVVAFSTSDLARIASALQIEPADLVTSHRRRSPRCTLPLPDNDVRWPCRPGTTDDPLGSENYRQYRPHQMPGSFGKNRTPT